MPREGGEGPERRGPLQVRVHLPELPQDRPGLLRVPVAAKDLLPADEKVRVPLLRGHLLPTSAVRGGAAPVFSIKCFVLFAAGKLKRVWKQRD